MKYDFETVLDRYDNGSVKWNLMKKKKPQVERGIVPFSIADMEFKNPPEIVEALKDCLDQGVLGYQTAEPSWYEAVTGWTRRRYGWETRPEWFYTTPGIVNALYHGVAAFTEEGDGVIVMPPVYYPFYKAVEENGRRLVRCPLIEGENLRYSIDCEKLEELASKPENRLLILCNPHNPVGRVWTREELMEVSRICLKHQVFVISDEIHCDLIMPGNTFTSFASLSEETEKNTMTCMAPSKTFNLAGLQASCVIIPDQERRRRLKAQMAKVSFEGRVNALGYKAMEAAYTKCDAWLDEAIQVIWENHRTLKQFMEERLPEILTAKLQGTYLQWMDLRAFGWTPERQEEIMTEADLFFDEGILFGPEGKGFERMNLACPKSVLLDALSRLEKAVRQNA
ncbi:UNVERIFIED_ORG: aminotransferase [Lacrimispora saccharolytica]